MRGDRLLIIISMTVSSITDDNILLNFCVHYRPTVLQCIISHKESLRGLRYCFIINIAVTSS